MRRVLFVLGLAVVAMLTGAEKGTSLILPAAARRQIISDVPLCVALSQAVPHPQTPRCPSRGTRAKPIPPRHLSTLPFSPC